MPHSLLSRRSVLQASSALLLSAVRVPAQAKTPSLALIAVGDWGDPNSHGQADVAREMGKTAAELGTKFTLSVGDNFYESGVDTTQSVLFRALFEQMYNAPSLQHRWDVLLGNHDYRGNVQAQIDYTALSPRWYMPARNFSRSETLADGTIVDFFYLDTSPFIRSYYTDKEHAAGLSRNAPEKVERQVAWLDAALGRSHARWKIVVGHHPLYTHTERNEKDLIEPFAPILARHHVPLYLNGHVHNLQCVERDGTVFVTTGAGGRKLGHVGHVDSTQFARETFGFVSLQIDRDRIATRFIDGHGAEVYAKAITA